MTDRRPNRSRGSQHDDWLRDAPSALARAFAPVAGYGVTISSMFRPVVTEQYPTRALTMSTDFDELVGPGREGLIYEKEDLLAPVPDGAVAAPHPMVEGTEDGDYYRGRVSGSTQAQIDWVRAHRPDDPSLAGARAKAVSTASRWGAKQTVKGAVR